jgi:hypothetical protein
MRMLVRVSLVLAAGCVALPAIAATSTPYSKGGRTRDFAVDVQKYRQSGELFRIRGHCQSACTMFLSLPNACVEPSARLLFHAAKTPQGTSDMINSYNGKLRAYLSARGAMDTPAFHTISGRDMISKFGYRRCP